MSRYQGGIITKSPATPTGPTTAGRAPGMWSLADAAYWTKQGLWPNANISAPDTYFPYVSLLLSTTALSNANNNLFVDSSGAFNPISRNGNTAQGSATPYGASWSNYFDGTGDYLTVPYTTALQFPGDFTVETWVYPTARLQLYPCIFSNYNFYAANGGLSIFAGHNSQNTAKYQVAFNGSFPVIQSTSDIIYNSWSHIALVRSGSTITLYVNGVANGTATSSATVTGTANNWWIGTTGDAVSQATFNGYISNLRAVKGTAVYTAAFTPPTAPLTAISGTSLLTCQSNRFRDASANNLTATPNGNTSVTEFSPFAPAYPGIVYNQSDITNWSGYFDGTGDWLSAPSNTAFAFGTGDFTMEAWVFRPATGNATIIAPGGGPGLIFYNTAQLQVLDTVTAGVLLTDPDTFPLNQWVHVACARASGTMRLFVNGALKASGSVTNNFTSVGVCYVGSWDGTNFNWTGYISNARVVKGTAVYTSAFTPPTTNLTAISGTSLLTCQNAAFTDNSTNNFVITPNGNTTVTGNSPFNPVGYWSNYFDGSGDYLTASPTALSTGDFTFECWIYSTGTGQYQYFYDTRASTNDAAGFCVIYNHASYPNKVSIYSNGFIGTPTIDIPVGAWTHYALVRSSGSWRTFVNGAADISPTSASRTLSNTALKIAAGQALDYFFNGYISNYRIVNGTAVYTTTFTPPTSPLTAISGTSLLTCQNGRFIDNSTNAFAITVNGNTSVQSFDPFYTSTIASNGGSMYFDGTGDYLALQSSPSYALGSGDFILEVWVNPTVQGGHGSGNNDCIIDFRPAANGAYGTLYSVNSGTSINWYANTAIRITGGAIPNGAWSHLCVSRVSGTTRLFINGVQSGSNYTDSTNYLQTNPWIGQFNDGVGSGFFQGYMSGMRIVKGSGISAAFTPPTAPQTPSANTTLLLNGMNAGAYDATAINDMETVGNAQVSTAVSKFGGSSIYVPSGGGCALIPNSQPLVLGSGNWTVEFWAYTDASGTKVYLDALNAANTTFQMEIYSSGTNLYWVKLGGSVAITATGALTANTWQHIAVTKSGSSTRLFVNGTQVGSTYTDNDTYDSARWEIGGRVNLTFPIVGYMDDFRITKGVARYTTTFTPPTQAFPAY